MTSKILIVDDEKDMCWTLSKFLGKHGYETDTAQEGDSALKKIQSENIDLVLLDIQMPGKDGLKVLKEIKALREKLPVIMITGYGSPEVAARAIQLGASDYLSKPFDNQTLLSVVQKHGPLQPQTTLPPIQFPDPVKLEPSQNKTDELFIPDLSTSSTEENKIVVFQLNASKIFLIFLSLLFIEFFYWDKLPITKNLFPVITQQFPLSIKHPSAITFYNNRIWVTDWHNPALIEYQPNTLQELYQISLEDNRASGIAWVKNDLYLCDSWQKKILQFKYSATERKLILIKSWTSPGTKPSGLCWDGKYLWSCDLDTGEIYQHELNENLTVLNEFPSPGRSPSGLTWNGKYIWSMDSDRNILYQHNSQNNMTVIKSYSLKKNFSENKKLAGISIGEEALWTISEEPANILKRSFGIKIGNYIRALTAE